MKNKFLLMILILFISLTAHLAVSGQTFDPPEATITLRKGTERDLIFKLAGSEVTPSAAVLPITTDFYKITAKTLTNTSVTLTISGTKAMPKRDVKIPFQVGDKLVEFPLSLQVTVDPATVIFNPGNITVEQQGDAKQVSMLVDGEAIANDRVKFAPSDPAIQAEYKNGVISVKASSVTTGTVIVLIDEVRIDKPITVGVEEGILELRAKPVVELFQGDIIKVKDLAIELIGRNQTNLTSTKCSSPQITPRDEKVFLVGNDFKVSSGTPGNAQITVSCAGKSKDIVVRILPKRTAIVVDKTSALLLPDRPVTLSAFIVDAEGKKIESSDIRLKWRLSGSAAEVSAAELLVSLQQLGNNLTVTQRANPSSSRASVNLEVSSLTDESLKEPVTLQLEQAATITDFAFLRVTADVLDDTTVKDDWGKQLHDNYHITKVQLTNALKKGETSEFFGSPILVYNQTLEAKVAFEYLHPFTHKWVMARSGDVATEDEPDTSKTLIIPRRKVDPKPCKIISQTDFILPYKPLDYNTALLTQESRQNRSLRSKILKGLQSLASATSFVTSIWIPGPLSDLPRGLDRFNNLLIPSYQKLFPDRGEVWRNNMISQFMLPLEEVAFGSQITKYLLFPKGEIKGMVTFRGQDEGGHDVSRPVPIRIVGISGSDACAEVAVIKKI